MPASRFRAAVPAAAGVLWLAACGGGGGAATPDASFDAAGPPDSLCAVPAGRAAVYHQIRILPPGEGFDLDGDGAVDNEIGRLPPAVLSAAHAGIDQSLATGELVVLYLVTGWSEPPTPDDPDVVFYGLSGYDGDMPNNPANNFTGMGEFYVRLDQFDLSCRPTTQADETALAGGVLTARARRWAFQLTTGTGALTIDEVIAVTTWDPTWAASSSRIGGRMSLCSLAALPFPGDTPGTALDAFANDPSIAAAVQPDVDVDGDGLEQVIGDGVSILKCIDGDGTTEIPGRDCPCHPSIVDAYSVGLRMDAVGARIIGVF